MDPRLMIGSRSPLLRGLTNSTNLNGYSSQKTNNQKGVSFQELLNGALNDSSKNEEFHISSHAQKRLNERNITMDSDLKSSLSEAFNELEAKGAKDSLVLTREGAFVVNVPSRTLITAMGFNEMRDNIVTNIDSVNLKFV